MPGDRKHHTDKFRRCVAQVMDKGHEESSAYAICTTQFQESGLPIFEAAEETDLRQLHLLGATGEVRIEMLDGREHYVVPVIALMEGVIHAVNAETPEFIPFETLEKAAESWNGKPVCLNHPVKDGRQCSAASPGILEAYGIGVIKNARTDKTKKRLLMDAWIDKSKVEQRHTKLATLLQAAKSVEVSVGAFVQTLKEAGQHLGKRFMASWKETAGDHLAFLPDGRGACSIDMGCGAHRAASLRVCEDGYELVTAAPLPEHSQVYPDAMGNREDYSGSRGSGYVQSLADGKYIGCYTPTDGEKVEREFDTKTAAEAFVKEHIGVTAAAGKRNSSADQQVIQEMHDRAVTLGAVCSAQHTNWAKEMMNAEGKEEVLKHLLTIWKDDTETLRERFTAAMYGKSSKKDCPMCKGTGSVDGNPCEGCDGNGYIKAAEQTQDDINRTLDDKAAAGDAAFRAACRCKESGMNKEQRDEIIKMLVADKHSGFTAGDEKLLEAADDARLESFKAAAEARAKVDSDLRAAAEKPFTREEFMEAAPPELKSLIKRQEKQEADEKAALIATLKACQNEYSEAELSVKDVDELKRMVRMANVEHKVDYRGKGVPRAAAAGGDEEDFTPPNPYEKGVKALQSQIH